MTIKNRLEIIAILGAQSLFWTKGFRQKDLTFIAQLFTNWIDVLIMPDIPVWNNTNSLRTLEALHKKGFLLSSGKLKNKRYHLTTVGLIELLNQLVDYPNYKNISHVILTHYFLKAYGHRMAELVTEKGSGFSKVTQHSIIDLLNPKNYLRTQIKELERQIERINIRLEETQKAYILAEKLNRQQVVVSDVIEKVSTEYPYELNNQQPMTELLKDIDPQLRLWELIEGNQYRHKMLLQPQLAILKANRNILKDILN